jgi:error-prone DNA polymerase
VFESNRRAVLSATMLGCRGKVQSANGVIHLIVEGVVDLSADLKTISGLDAGFRLQSGRGDDAKRGGSALDSREPKAAMVKPRDMYEPDLHIDTLKLKARNFR